MAKRPLTAEELVELDQLCQQSILIWDFMSQRDELVRSLAPEAKKAVEVAYKKQDLRALRAASREDSEWIGSLTPSDQQLLRGMIAKVSGGEPGGVETNSLDPIHRIVLRRKIRNADEYRTVFNRVEEIHQDPNHREEVMRLNELLLEYDSTS